MLLITAVNTRRCINGLFLRTQLKMSKKKKNRNFYFSKNVSNSAESGPAFVKISAFGTVKLVKKKKEQTLKNFFFFLRSFKPDGNGPHTRKLSRSRNCRQLAVPSYHLVSLYIIRNRFRLNDTTVSRRLSFRRAFPRRSSRGWWATLLYSFFARP